MGSLRNCVCLFLLLPSVVALGTVIVPGDVYIEFIDTLYVNDACTIIDTEIVQNLQAVKWTIDQLNHEQFTPFQIGLLVNPTCNSIERANRIAFNIAAEASYNETTNIVGVIGAGNSGETAVISRLLSSLPEEYRLLQISYASTSASLTDRNIYKNLFRTIPTDTIQVEVMRELIKSLNWTYMAIIYEDNTYGIGGLNGLLNNIEHSDICFPETIAINNLNETYIKEILRTKVFKVESVNLSDPPVSGILIFGTSQLSETVLKVVEKIQDEYKTDPNITIYPVFLLSETSVYMEGKFADVSKGAFIPSPRRIQIDSFQDYITDLLLDKDRLYQYFNTDTYLKDWYGHLYDCEPADTVENDTCQTLSGTEIRSKLQPSLYNQYAILAVGTLAVAVKEVHTNKCGSTTPLCEEFFNTNITNRYEFFKTIVGKTINFDIEFGTFRIKEFQNPDLKMSFDESVEMKLESDYSLYEVFNHQICDISTKTACLRKVAEYNSNTLSIDTSAVRDYDFNAKQLFWPNIRKPQCPDGFRSLKCLTEKTVGSILYIEGDLYIVGIVPVHNIGVTPLQCGDTKQGGLDIVESMRYSIDIKGHSLGAKVGLIIIDSCNDPQIVQERVLTLHRYGVYVDGEYRQVSDKILGYVGGWSSDVSTSLAFLTTRLEKVQISYASTSTELSKRSLYPYFLRIPSPDDQQAKTIVKIIKALGGNFIQVLYSKSRYGEGGRDLIRELATKSEYKLCIANEIPIDENHDTSDIIVELKKQPDARFVVVFVGSFDVENIIDGLNAGLRVNEFLLIASEGWGKRQNPQQHQNLVGTITVTSELNIDEGFNRYLQTLKPDGTNKNPWIREYMETYYNCYYQWSFDKTGNVCSNEKAIGDSSYDVELWMPFSERAVDALLIAASNLLGNVCGNTTHLCDAFNVTTYIDEMMTLQMKGSIGSADQDVFDSNGDGTTGYFIYMLDNTGQYIRIGHSIVDEFNLKTDYLYYSLNSTCGTQSVCKRCFSGATTSSESNDLPVGAIVVIVLLGLVCCVLAAILLYVCNRHGCCFKIEDGRLKFSNTYLTPVHFDRQAQGPIDGSEGRELVKLPDENYHDITTFIREAQTRTAEGQVSGDSNGSYQSSKNNSSGGTQNQGYI